MWEVLAVHEEAKSVEKTASHFRQDGSWLGLDDAAVLISCAEAGLVLVAFDRATLP